jgi:hypothetical protein
LTDGKKHAGSRTFSNWGACNRQWSSHST